MAGTLTLQPQRVPLGSFTDASGREVKVYIETPWYRALNQFLNSASSGPSPSPPADSVTIDPTPGFEFGDLVYSSEATRLKRLRSTEIGDVLYNGGPGVAPFWAPLPTPAPPPVVAPQLVLYALTGEALLTLDGGELQTL